MSTYGYDLQILRNNQSLLIQEAQLPHSLVRDSRIVVKVVTLTHFIRSQIEKEQKPNNQPSTTANTNSEQIPPSTGTNTTNTATTIISTPVIIEKEKRKARERFFLV